MWERKEICSDPALNRQFKSMRELLQEKDRRIQKLEEEQKGTQYTPNTSTGKKLVEKCKVLQEENDEFSRHITDGIIQNYKLEIAELKRQLKQSTYEMAVLHEENEEFRRQNSDLESVVEVCKKNLKDAQAKNVLLEKELGTTQDKENPKMI